MILFEEPAVLDIAGPEDGDQAVCLTIRRRPNGNEPDPSTAADSLEASKYPRAIYPPRGSGGTRLSAEGGEDMGLLPRAARRMLRLARTVDEALTPTLEHWQASRAPNTYRAYAHHCTRHLIPAIGDLALEQVTAHHVEVDILDCYRSTPSAASHAVRVLSAAYTTWSRWQWVPHGYNPCQGVKLHTGETRPRVAENDELPSLWARLEHYQQSRKRAERDAADILALIALTGARKGVYERLQWTEVDLDGGRLSLQQNTGRKRARYVILPAAAVELLRGRADRYGTHGPVFPKAWKVRRLWEAIREEIGAPDLTIHDLRRTWSTLLGEAGIEAEDAAETLGQKTVAVHRRHYRILREPRLREIAELGAQQMRGKL